MVPAKSGADRPVSQTDAVLHEYGLLQIRTISLESKGTRRIVVELAWIGDDVIKILIQKGVVGLGSELPFMPAMIDGRSPFEICLAKPIVLKNFDRRRIRIGVEVVRIVTEHGAEIRGRIARKGVLVRGNSHGLNIVGGLPLSRGLLHLLVGKLVA